MRLIRLLTTLLSIVTIVLCNIAAYRLAIDGLIDAKFNILLIIFNLFFLSLFVLVNGSIIQKSSLLAAGNIMGLLLNFFFFHIQLTGSAHFGATFTALCTLIYPIFNLMWIVPFCSLTLSTLPKLPPNKL